MADTPSFWRDILQTLLENSEGITIGVVAVLIILGVIFGVMGVMRLYSASGTRSLEDRQDERETNSTVTENLFTIINTSFLGIADNIRAQTAVSQEIKEAMSEGRKHHIEEMGLLQEAKTEVGEVLMNVMNIQDKLNHWESRGRGVFVLDAEFKIQWYSEAAKEYIDQDLTKNPSFLSIPWYDLSKSLISDGFLKNLIQCTPREEAVSFLKRPSSIIGLLKKEDVYHWYLIETYPHEVPSQPDAVYYLIVLQEFAELTQLEEVSDAD